MQAERPVLTCSPSFPTTTTSCSESTPRPKWTHHQKSETEVPNDSNSTGVFDFSFDCGGESVSSPISADQIFHNGKIKPTLPLPNHLFFHETEIEQDPKLKKEVTSRRKELRRLFVEDREPASSSLSSSSSGSTSSSSCSEIDEHETTLELDSVPENTYSVWKPNKSVEENNAKIKKGEGSSSSASLSMRWKLMDLLTRNSGSGGGRGGDKDNSSTSKRHEEETVKESVVKKMVKKIGASGRKSVELLPQSTTKKEGGAGGGGGEKKRMSYLPYRQELVGIFGNSNGSRNQQR